MWYAFRSGLADQAAIYTWRSWLAGWYLRVLAQVIFFALIGRLLGSPEQTWFLLVGNAIVLAALGGLFAIGQVTWERESGSLQLLAASPSSPVVVFAARGSFAIIDGLLSALGALFVAGPLFGLPLPWPRVLLVVPLTLLVGISAYFFGLFIAGVIIRARKLGVLVANVGRVALMLLCAVNVPLAAYPDPVAALARVLPLTNGLIAIREVLAGNPASALAHTALELAVAAAWLTVCLATFTRFIQHGRRDGTLDFAS